MPRTRASSTRSKPPAPSPVETRNVLDGAARALHPTVRRITSDLRTVTVLSPGRVEIRLSA